MGDGTPSGGCRRRVRASPATGVVVVRAVRALRCRPRLEEGLTSDAEWRTT